MNSTLERYIIEHSSAENPALEELYRQTHIKFVNPNMSTGFVQGRFLEMISKMMKPNRILEIGTFTGYSTICLALGLESDGKLTTIEINDELRDFANSFFIKTGVESKIQQITGDALTIIPTLEEKFDLVYIDGDKREYCDYYDLAFDKVKKGGFIIADNTLWGGKILDNNAQDQQTKGVIEFNNMLMDKTDIEHIIIPLRDGVTIIRKK